MEEMNGKQNERIVKLEVEVKNLSDNFKSFISNDFEHLRKAVNWLTGLVVTGILIPILLFIIK